MQKEIAANGSKKIGATAKKKLQMLQKKQHVQKIAAKGQKK